MRLLLPPGVIRVPRMTECFLEHGRNTLGHEVRFFSDSINLLHVLRI